MPIESANDRRSLLIEDGDVGVLGRLLTDDETAVLEAERAVTGLFDRGYEDDGETAGYSPRFLLVDEDAVGIGRDHRVLLAGHVWAVRTPQPDGEGFTQLTLRLLGPFLPRRAFGLFGEVQYDIPYGPSRGDAEFDVPYGDGLGVSSPTFDPEHPRLKYPFTLEGVFERDTDSLAWL